MPGLDSSVVRQVEFGGSGPVCGNAIFHSEPANGVKTLILGRKTLTPLRDGLLKRLSARFHGLRRPSQDLPFMKQGLIELKLGHFLMDNTHTYLARLKDADPEEFVYISTSPVGTQMKTMTGSFSADDFRSDMAKAGMPTSEIEAKIAHARANPM